MLFFAVANNICMRCHAAAAIGPLATAAAVLQLKVCCCTMADDIDTSCAQGTLVHPATKLFPLVHSFVDSGDTNPVGSWIRVDMAHFMRFLQSAHCLCLCPIYLVKTQPNTRLQPLSKYVTIAHDLHTKADGQTSPRRYKYAEGLVNLQLTSNAAGLRDDVQVVTVHRSCHKSCQSIAWQERASIADIRNRTVQVRFSSFFMQAELHTSVCVPDATASQRTKPLVAQHVVAKGLCRVQQLRRMDLESGVVPINIRSLMAPEVLQLAATISPRMARDAFKNTRKVGREGQGDFDVMHRILNTDVRRILSPMQPPYSRVVPIPTDMAGDHELRVIEYHPAADPSCGDVDNPASWYWIIVRYKYDQRDMAAHGSVTGVSYDAKIKFMIDGMLVMPICTTEDAYPTMPGLGTPANGCRRQHVTYPNYMLLANTEKAEVITAATTTIRDFLQCDQLHCDHSCVYEFKADGGFTVTRPACAHNSRPGLWKTEGFDAARHTHTSPRAHARRVF